MNNNRVRRVMHTEDYVCLVEDASGKYPSTAIGDGKITDFYESPVTGETIVEVEFVETNASLLIRATDLEEA